jgi:hypothetical protein
VEVWFWTYKEEAPLASWRLGRHTDGLSQEEMAARCTLAWERGVCVAKQQILGVSGLNKRYIPLTS